MKLSSGSFHSIVYLLLATFSTLVVRSESCECPTSPGTFNFTDIGANTIPIPPSKGLCTLVQVSPDGLSFKPVARSYAGNRWEAYSGEFASLKWTCTGTSCNVILPPLEDGAKYQLTTFANPTSSAVRKNEIARFLEQATFGPTRSEIAKLNTTANLQQAFAAWIKDQQSKVPLTSHRAAFRQRMNSRMETATHVGAVTHPCQKGAVYRRYAFTSKDHGKYVDIETVGTKRIISVDGFVRTVVEGPVVKYWDQSFEWPDGRYVHCSHIVHILLARPSSQLTQCLPQLQVLRVFRWHR
jgi:hypothetical protein